MSWPVVALLSLTVFWLGLVILLTRWPISKNKSISQLSASHKESFIFFTVVQVAAGFALYLFVIRWFIPYFHMSLLFTIVYTITAWLQITSAFIPDAMKGWKSTWHQHLANTFAIGMLITTLLILIAPTVHGWPKLLFLLVAIYMVAYASILASIKGKPHLAPNYLAAQITYIVSFQLAFLAATFYK